MVKAGQILNLVVRQLPTTIHKALINTVTSCGFIAWEIMGVTVNSRLCEQADTAGQSFLGRWGQ